MCISVHMLCLCVYLYAYMYEYACVSVLCMYICVLCGCGGLNENVPHGLICLNFWSPVGRTLCEGLGGVFLLKDVCPWR